MGRNPDYIGEPAQNKKNGPVPPAGSGVLLRPQVGL